MLPDQSEGSGIVIEIVTVCVDPIVAGQAIIPVSQDVGLHEIGLDLLVAGCTYGLVKFGIAIYMTGIAKKKGSIRHELVGSECIPEVGVCHLDLGNVRHFCVRSKVIVMAIPTGCTWVVVLQVSMQRGWIFQLGCNICVAGHALVRHAGGLPESRMAGGAFIAEGGV
jgi:hypothetical protein